MSWKMYIGHEIRFQETAFQILKSRSLLAFHVANERKTSTSYGGKLRKQGVTPGVSDLIILEPRGEYHGMIVELKAGAGSKGTDDQMDFLFRSQKNGYFVLLTWSLDEFIHYLDQYFNLERGERIIAMNLPYEDIEGKLWAVNWNRLKRYKKS